MKPLYSDRQEAGMVLGRQLAARGFAGDFLVLGLPRGGIPVAFQVAQALHAPLDVFVVRKLGTPGQEELAMGAIASGGARVLNPDVIGALGITSQAIEAAVEAEQRELDRRERAYRAGRPPPDVRGRSVILVDDGLATGATMRAAVAALRELGSTRIVVAVPVGAAQTCADLAREADEVVCAATPDPFYGVGMWYADFSQTSDDEVRGWLERGREPAPAGAH